MSENGQPRARPGATWEDMEALGPTQAYAAAASRDPRFDGLFFVGVTTTGIYCRPVCTARTPARDRCKFFRHAAEAEREGFRACFLCRPELAPGNSTVDRTARLATLAAQRIEQGEADLDALAESLGVTARHLRRVLARELGVSPVELRQSKRIALAKQLLCDTRLPITEVAYASGFASVRRFNALFRARFDRSPTEARRGRGPRERGDGTAIRLRLDYRPPFDWGALLAFLRDRAIPGVEEATADAYRRTVRIHDRTGWISVSPDGDALTCEVSLSLTPVLMPLVARVRALFDLDAQPRAVADALSTHRRLAPLVRRSPGLRVPGAVDGFELAVRSILGQQISVAGARTLAGKLAARYGERVSTPFAGLCWLFPTPAALARSGWRGVPRARSRAIALIASAVSKGTLDLAPTADVERTRVALSELPGIGAWTAEYIAMRALRWPDAFPAEDLIVRRALGSPARAIEALESVRPWRAYAVMHLWRNHEVDDSAR